ncbi:serine/threonine-protein kinase PCRK1, partial [Tanacetum coccineum]
MKAMKCFTFSHGEPKTTKSTSGHSKISMLNGQEGRKSGSEFTSMDMSDLKTATKNFSQALMIGEGGFEGVYRSVILKDDGSGQKIDVAVKQLSKGLTGHKECGDRSNVLVFVDHTDLGVKLVGSVQIICLKASNTSSVTLLDSNCTNAARGLLLSIDHSGNFQIIFRDFKSSNILLDENWNAKLSDFGLARLGPSDGIGHVSTAVVGTVGYAAPEYVQTGRLTYKSD